MGATNDVVQETARRQLALKLWLAALKLRIPENQICVAVKLASANPKPRGALPDWGSAGSSEIGEAPIAKHFQPGTAMWGGPDVRRGQISRKSDVRRGESGIRSLERQSKSAT